MKNETCGNEVEAEAEEGGVRRTLVFEKTYDVTRTIIVDVLAPSGTTDEQLVSLDDDSIHAEVFEIESLGLHEEDSTEDIVYYSVSAVREYLGKGYSGATCDSTMNLKFDSSGCLVVDAEPLS